MKRQRDSAEDIQGIPFKDRACGTGKETECGRDTFPKAAQDQQRAPARGIGKFLRREDLFLASHYAPSDSVE